MFVDYTIDGELASSMREHAKRLYSVTCLTVKVVERAGTSLKEQFPTTTGGSNSMGAATPQRLPPQEEEEEERGAAYEQHYTKGARATWGAPGCSRLASGSLMNKCH